MRPDGEVLERFVELLGELESGRGDPERFFAAHPHFEGRLRAAYRNWLRLTTFFREVGTDRSLVRSALRELGAAGQVHRGQEALSRLAGLREFRERYALGEEIARGGMGIVRRVRDRVLGRELAMKVIDPEVPGAGGRLLRRFLEEAELGGRLDHPGIVPIHELGLDSEGRAYFTMPLVRGRTLEEVLRLERAREEGWTLLRVLEVLLKVCDAVAYAHSRGLVHRDLKPANVMVGRFGEVLVMDWGLARVSGEAKREATEPGLREVDAGLTLEGEVLGTPAYMAPEQAEGRSREVDVRADVYALGAILYELLTGYRPYAGPAATPSSRETLEAVRRGPPKDVEELAPIASAELASICRRAMAREPSERYGSMQALAEDLRAYVEGRVVRAHEHGAWAEARKWIRRNRGLALALVGLIVALVVGLAVSLLQRNIARTEKVNVLRLSAFQNLRELEVQADQLWPITPEHVPAYRKWLEDARALVRRLDPDPEHGDPGLRAQLATLREREADWSEEDRWWVSQLEELIGELEAFADPDQGLMRGIPPGEGWGIARRLAFAETVGERSITGTAASVRWKEAIAAISNPQISPAYNGFVIEPELGLLPLGHDLQSGLYEFAHLLSGEPAERGGDGRLVLTEETGIVLVLLPGGESWIGAQSEDPAGMNYDSQAAQDEGPVHRVELSPFLLSKYEMTRGQWLRWTGVEPASPFSSELEIEQRLLHPALQINWHDCQAVLPRMDLSLPSEAQWEHAARGGTHTPWWTGDDFASLPCVANLTPEKGPSFEDVYSRETVHRFTTKVGLYPPNPFGLHDVHGNVSEWCLDGYDFYHLENLRDPVRKIENTRGCITRGGGFTNSCYFARSAERHSDEPGERSGAVGVRPARPLKGR